MGEDREVIQKSDRRGDLMKFVVAAMRGVYLVEDFKYTKTLLSKHATYSGVTWSDKYIYVAFRGEINISKDHYEGILKLDKDWNIVSELHMPDVYDTHQPYYHNGKLYVTCTNKNTIKILDADSLKLLDEVAIYGQRGGDIHHVNGLWWWPEEEKMLVCLHNNGRTSEVLFMNEDLHSMYKVVSAGLMAHDPYIEDGHLYLSSSRTAALIKYNLASREVTEIPLVGWPRGLARTKDYWISGISAYHKIREERQSSKAFVLVMNNSFDEAARINIPQGAIYDIRVLDEEDRRHYNDRKI